VRALLLAVALVTAAAALPARAAADAHECQGLMVCIPVAGPWVAVPAPTGAEVVATQYLLSCPRGSVAAGTDALVSDRALDVSWLASLGAPIGPGVSSHDAIDYLGTYTGAARRPSGFQPYVGCVPAQGGGGRSTTAFHPFAARALPPGQPLVRRTRTVQVSPTSPTTVTVGCNRGEHVIGGAHALAFPQKKQPPIEWLGDVRGTRRIIDGRVVVSATRGDAIPPNVRVVLQVQALCGRPG
jgi:hypothetical protein